jgi:hypothetical protein
MTAAQRSSSGSNFSDDTTQLKHAVCRPSEALGQRVSRVFFRVARAIQHDTGVAFSPHPVVTATHG